LGTIGGGPLTEFGVAYRLRPLPFLPLDDDLLLPLDLLAELPLERLLPPLDLLAEEPLDRLSFPLDRLAELLLERSAEGASDRFLLEPLELDRSADEPSDRFPPFDLLADDESDRPLSVFERSAELPFDGPLSLFDLDPERGAAG